MNRIITLGEFIIQNNQTSLLLQEPFIEDYPNGIYFVQISYDNYSFSYKLVVNR